MNKIFIFLMVVTLGGCADYKQARQDLKSGNVQSAQADLEKLAYTYGHNPSKVELADFYIENYPAESHGEKAQTLLNDVEGEDKGEALFLLGEIYEDGYGVPQDGGQAVSYYERAIEKDYWKAKFNLARLYQKGELVPQDQEKALALYQDLVDRHDYDRAQEEINDIKIDQAIAENNVQQAETLLLAKVNNGGKNAELELARFYRDHYTEGEKDQEILNLFYKSALKGEDRALYDLGRIYEGDVLKRVSANGNMALNYYTRAANLGNWRADYRIGRLYDRGELVAENKDMARAYYNKVLINNDYEPAEKALAKL